LGNVGASAAREQRDEDFGCGQRRQNRVEKRWRLRRHEDDGLGEAGDR